MCLDSMSCREPEPWQDLTSWGIPEHFLLEHRIRKVRPISHARALVYASQFIQYHQLPELL